MIDVNLKGVLYSNAAALPYMTAQKSGHILNVSSVAGHKVGPGSAVYATKHAVRALSEGLRQEVKPCGTRIRCAWKPGEGKYDFRLKDWIMDLRDQQPYGIPFRCLYSADIENMDNGAQHGVATAAAALLWHRGFESRPTGWRRASDSNPVTIVLKDVIAFDRPNQRSTGEG
jgi:NAD(P)-dependent dehydrogenase (short-subunit alcohol dehydrogenase family)